MSDSGVPTGAAVLVDTNVFFAIGGPSNSNYRRFRDTIRAAEASCWLPQRVVEELGGPETDRIETALSAGWVETAESPDQTDGDVVTATDVARRTIASETDRPEHDIEKADTALAGLGVQFARRRSVPVVVVTNDIPARAGVEHAVVASGYDETIDVCVSTRDR
ncbi:MAG: hypothetical protein J07HB67_02327 [halophilic archaeon J07HB67]|jgi:hypothetical protein|nr:MAG: hypothetical protein J07HB67_02327 [halophilic archaeon J07HB67]